jgi:hypothetical protein
LPSIIGAFKPAVARRINLGLGTPGAPVWQRNYYEHVIRDESALNRIREYIINNPLSCDLDRENPERKGEGEFYRWQVSKPVPALKEKLLDKIQTLGARRAVP